MTATLQKYRIIKQPGKPVGPHVDFARDEQGNILRGRPYVDDQGRQMPGDPIERQYYPGDEVWSEVDLTQSVDGPDEVPVTNPQTGQVQMVRTNKAGLCRAKFERVNEVEIGPTELEEFRAWKAAKAQQPQDERGVPNPPAGLQVNEDLNKVVKAAAQQRMSPESLNAKSYKELIDLAKAEGVDLKGASKKEDLVKILLAALNA